MISFANEYAPRMGRAETNRWVGEFVWNLQVGLKREFSLLLAFPPNFTNAAEGMNVNAPFRAIDFDNAPSGEVFRAVDSPERWLYLYLRQSVSPVNSGVFCCFQRISRDADPMRGEAISVPVISVALNVKNYDYNLDYAQVVISRVAATINAAASAASSGSADRVLGGFKRMDVRALMKRHRFLGFDDAVSLEANENPVFVTGLKDIEPDARDAGFWKDAPYVPQACGALYARVKPRVLAVPFVEIGLHPTFGDLDEKINVYGPLYRERLKEISGSTEWSLGFTIRLAPLLA